MSNRLAVFDCDGTLVDSAVNICEAMERCFAVHALPLPDRRDTRRVVGLSLVEAVRALHPAGDDAQHRVMADDYKRAFQTMRGAGTVVEPLFDGISDAIAALGEAGWLLGVATGKSDRGLAHCLEAHDIARRFVTLQTADRHPSKPHPAMLRQAMADAGARPETTVMIGDTSYDIEMARNAGVHAIGVGWGYHGPEELMDAGAHFVARDAAALTAYLASMA